MLIPKGFIPIAVRDDRLGKCIISYNPDPAYKSLNKYFLVVNGHGLGPISLNDLKTMVENIKDVIELRGRYMFIEEYDPDGTRKED